MRRKLTQPCPEPGCPNAKPCPKHSRASNAPWSKDRDRGQQHHFRQALRERDRDTCQRCGKHDPTGRSLVAHHIRPGYHASAGVLLCHDCHAAVDTNAR